MVTDETHIEESPKLNYPEYRSMNLYVMLGCGILLSAIGVYLIYKNTFIRGLPLKQRDLVEQWSSKALTFSALECSLQYSPRIN